MRTPLGLHVQTCEQTSTHVQARHHHVTDEQLTWHECGEIRRKRLRV